MYRCLLRVLTISGAVLGVACASNQSSAEEHETTMKTHLEFARDFEQTGNEGMARYHLDKAAMEDEQRAAAECGLLCTIISDLLDSKPDSFSSGSCRDPVTNPPSGPPRC